MNEPGDRIFGREVEIAEVRGFIDSVPEGPAVLLFEGEAGAGKTTLWTLAREAAVDKGYTMLFSRPVESETALPFTALGDLLERVADRELSALPAPQRHALEVALLRTEAEGPPPAPRAVSLAVLGVIRALAADRPVVVALDDVPWVDHSSVRVLEFVFRRLGTAPVGILAATRTGESTALRQAFTGDIPPGRLRHVILGPLDADALGRILRARLDTDLAPSTIAKIHRASGGNPFYALELALALRRRGKPAAGEPLPLPDDARVLIRERLEVLSPATRDALLVVSALPVPTEPVVEQALGTNDPLREATDAGLVTVEDGRIRFAHPLFGAVVYAEATSLRLREIHRDLAGFVADPEERARHMALGAEGPDADVAAALDDAARLARARGAPDAAAELAEMARKLTPASSTADALSRAVDAADCHFAAGDTARAKTLLAEAVAQSPPGPGRGAAMCRLGQIATVAENLPKAIRLFHTVIEEAGDDLRVRAAAEQLLSFSLTMRGDVLGGAEHARAALGLARRLDDPAALAMALSQVCWTTFLLGRGFDTGTMNEALGLEKHVGFGPMEWHPRFTASVIRLFADDLEGARSGLETLYRRAQEGGHEGALPALMFGLGQLECWSGNWALAERHASEGIEASVQTGQGLLLAQSLYARALVYAHMGETDAARADADEALRLAEGLGAVATMSLVLPVLGFLALSEGDPAEADRRMGALAEIRASIGVGEPGLARFFPDQIEALVALREHDRARALLDVFEERARSTGRPWALATSARCRGLLAAASGDLDEAVRALEEALEHHRDLANPFERARTLYVLGTVQRRALKKAAARRTLEEALRVFDDLGAALWSKRARAELGRIGGRAAAPTDLTPTEQRVAELVAAGRTNREVAAELFMTVRTVESNLTRAYRKLGVRSRSELARRLSGP